MVHPSGKLTVVGKARRSYNNHNNNNRQPAAKSKDDNMLRKAVDAERLSAYG